MCVCSPTCIVMGIVCEHGMLAIIVAMHTIVAMQVHVCRQVACVDPGDNCWFTTENSPPPHTPFIIPEKILLDVVKVNEWEGMGYCQ